MKLLSSAFLLLSEIFTAIEGKRNLTLTVLAPSLDDIISSEPNRSVTDFPFHWQNVRPVIESAIEYFKLDELYDLEFELVPDGGCKTVDIIEPATKRFYQSLRVESKLLFLSRSFVLAQDTNRR